MGRKKKKSDYNPEKLQKELMNAVVECYFECEPHRTIDQVADMFGMTRMKVRKILVSAGVFESEKAEMVVELFQNGRTVEEIQMLTGLSRSSVHSYLPYGKRIYKMEEVSTDAERVRRWRERKKMKDLKEKSRR